MPDGLTSGVANGASSASGNGNPQTQPTSQSSGASPQRSEQNSTTTTQATTVQTAATGTSGQSGEQSQQSQPQQPAQQKPNLFESPEFRNVQRQWEQQIAQQRRQNEQLLQQMKQQQRAGMSEDEQLRADLADRDQQLAQLRNQVEQQQLMNQIVQDFQQLSGFSGVPVEELFDAYKSGKVNNLVDAQYMAMERMKQNFEKAAAQKAEQIVQKQEANEVVTGGGSPMSGDDMRMQRLREYTKKKDSVGYFRELLRTEE